MIEKFRQEAIQLLARKAELLAEIDRIDEQLLATHGAMQGIEAYKNANEEAADRDGEASA